MPKTNRKPGIHLHKTEQLWPTDGPAEYYWVLIAKNGKTIARSSETYKRKRDAVHSIEVAATIFLGGKPYELITYYDHTGKNSVELVKF